MNTKQWNWAMASGLITLVVIAIPFFALAQDMDFGGFSNMDFGGFSDMDFGGFSNADFGGFSNADFGGFSNANFGGLSGANTPVSGTNDGTGTTQGNGGFNPFDGDFGPGNTPPGNPGGFEPLPNPNPIPCVVNCNPGPGPIPTPTPVPQPHTMPKAGASDSLHIFINQIVLHDAFEQLPGDQVPMLITFENDGTKNLENTKVIITIPDIAVRAAIGPFDLHVGSQLTKVLILELPEWVRPGTYPVRFQVYNENRERIVHREIEVIDHE